MEESKSCAFGLLIFIGESEYVKELLSHWNTLVYKLWAPFYDTLLGALFAPARQRAMGVLDLRGDERVLLVGVGTGADLPHLPGDTRAVGIDFSPAMLAQAVDKLPSMAGRASLSQADAQRLPVLDNSVDVAVLSLILSVVPNGQHCFNEAMRALRPGGRLLVFDKFLPNNQQLTLPRQMLNLITVLFGTNINRRFSDIAAGHKFTPVYQEASLFGGAYQIILIQKED